MKFLVLLSLLLVINVQAIAMDDVDEVFFFESIPEDMQSNPRQLVGGYYNNLAATVKTVYSTLTLCNNLVSSSCAIYGAALVAAFQAINVSSTGVTFDSTSCKVACTDSSRRILSRSFISGYIIIKNTFYSAGDLQSAINVNPLFISQLQSTTQYLATSLWGTGVSTGYCVSVVPIVTILSASTLNIFISSIVFAIAIHFI